MAASEFMLPVIDLLQSFSSDIEGRQKVAEEIQAACASTGFFYIKNHNVDEKICNNALSLAKHFFTEFPLQKKEELHVKHSNQLRGWEPAGYTKVGDVKETKEAFNWDYEASLVDTDGDGMYVSLDGQPGSSNVWPREDDFPGFFQGVKQYYGEMLQLARHLLRLFALSLGCDETHFDSMVTHPGAIGRMIHYPAHHSTHDNELGVGEHTDYECFTILLQSEVGGLEIKTPQGTWIRAVPIEGTFVVNVSDLMMRLTNNRYKSAVHRVVNQGTERYSIPFFFSFNYDAIVEPLLEDGEVAQFAPVSAGRYILGRINDMINQD